MKLDIVLVTRVRIFCTTLFTKNNIKIVIKSSTFLDHLTLLLPLLPEIPHKGEVLPFHDELGNVEPRAVERWTENYSGDTLTTPINF